MTLSQRASSSPWIGWSAGLACVLAAAAAGAHIASLHGQGGDALPAQVTALVLLLLPYFLLGTTDLGTTLSTWLKAPRTRTLVLIALPVVPYLIDASATRTFSWSAMLVLSGYVLLPLGLLLWAERAGAPPRLQDALAVLAIWLPLELGWLRDAWSASAAAGAYPMKAILGVDVGVLLFVSVRGLEGVGYRFAIRPADLRAAFWNLLMFLVIGIPIALSTRFVGVVHGVRSFVDFAGQFFGILLVIAVPEELLFRGLIQNLLSKVLPSTYALLVAALIFGASHLNNGPAPDWRYFLLASIAGIFYGRAYQRSGGLMAACLVHAAVDTIWREVFK